MTRFWCVLLVCVGGLALAPAASAQALRNPGGATFMASPDHGGLSSYTIGFFVQGAADPVQTADLGKPTPDATGTCTVVLNVMPLSFGANYIARVKAVAGGVESDWSAASNPFDRAPGPPSKPVVK